MTDDEAKQITAALFRMYPNSGAGHETMEGFFEFFHRLQDPSVAIEAVQDVVLVETRLPSIAAIKAAYGARVRLKQGDAPALEPGDFMENGAPFPQTPEQWERLGQAHRELRAKHFGETPDPFADKPLPRSHREFDREWVTFMTARSSGKPATRGMEL